VAGRCDEFTTPLRPRTVYGRCKNELREWAEHYARGTGVSFAWARLFFLYGPREHPDRLVPSVARSLLRGHPVACSDGTQRRDYLHVDDAADALVGLLQSDLVGPVNVGAGWAVPVREVIDVVARECGRPELVRLGARPAPPDDPPLLVANVGRLRDELGWRPRIALPAGLAETVRWWRDQLGGREAA
jgi:nucleoside-diphosphate-sugar epimerase